jgi:hypothetical protein
MISRNLSRRLERLEELRMPSGVQHVIKVTYVNTDGTPTGEGYRVEIPSRSPSQDSWRRSAPSPSRTEKRTTPSDDK